MAEAGAAGLAGTEGTAGVPAAVHGDLHGGLHGGLHSASIETLRARGAQRLDPLRFGFIEALARRAQAHVGDTRRLLDSKLAVALAACAARLDSGSQASGPALARGDALSRPGPGPLADLLRRLDEHLPPDAAAPVRPLHSAPAELKALRQFRSTWAQLSVDRQLRQSLARVPENAGPLNSNLLVQRSLARLRELSPAYLARFMAYADALLWLQDAEASVAPLKKPVVGGIRPARAPASPKRG